MDFQDIYYQKIRSLFTKYSPSLKNGVYIIDLYTDQGITELLKEALIQIYKGTYYVNQDEYLEKFAKKGNIFVTYLEGGKPLIGSCILWHDTENRIIEIGQGYSLPNSSKLGYLALVITFKRILHRVKDLPLLAISTCRKSATDETSEKFGMIMTGMIGFPALRVDMERILDMGADCEEIYRGDFYNILYQTLNYHFLALKSRIKHTMGVPDEFLNHPLLKTYWSYYPEKIRGSHPFQNKSLRPIEIRFLFDESNHEVEVSFWPISHPDIRSKLDYILHQKYTEPGQFEFVSGTLGPYFYDAEHDLYIPGVIFMKGSMASYFISVKNEIYRSIGPNWKQLPENIQSLLFDAFQGLNVTNQTRKFYFQNWTIFTYLCLDIKLFLGMTYSEKMQIVKAVKQFPKKISEQQLIGLIKIIIQKKSFPAN